ncbi:hypothetical protein QJR30_10665 [Paraclostridium sordellii]|uniref:hypothetical protein n=1 Tax=Paraclostridium sordellii TaxID=1505 RepID=UPI0030CA66F8
MSRNKPREAEYKYVCSHFVADMLDQSGIKLFDQPPYAIRPNDFFNHKDLTLEYEGLLSAYRAKEKIFEYTLSSI